MWITAPAAQPVVRDDCTTSRHTIAVEAHSHPWHALGNKQQATRLLFQQICGAVWPSKAAARRSGRKMSA